uniref:Uncharacterized protein n=1 Tax=Caenorhabditis tropicalis TaxID=1561998 RepID=A0A1I7UQ72_9PELO
MFSTPLMPTNNLLATGIEVLMEAEMSSYCVRSGEREEENAKDEEAYAVLRIEAMASSLVAERLGLFYSEAGGGVLPMVTDIKAFHC